MTIDENLENRKLCLEVEQLALENKKLDAEMSPRVRHVAFWGAIASALAVSASIVFGIVDSNADRRAQTEERQRLDRQSSEARQQALEDGMHVAIAKLLSPDDATFTEGVLGLVPVARHQSSATFVDALRFAIAFVPQSAAEAREHSRNPSSPSTEASAGAESMSTAMRLYDTRYVQKVIGNNPLPGDSRSAALINLIRQLESAFRPRLLLTMIANANLGDKRRLAIDELLELESQIGPAVWELDQIEDDAVQAYLARTLGEACNSKNSASCRRLLELLSKRNAPTVVVACIAAAGTADSDIEWRRQLVADAIARVRDVDVVRIALPVLASLRGEKAGAVEELQEYLDHEDRRVVISALECLVPLCDDDARAKLVARVVEHAPSDPDRAATMCQGLVATGQGANSVVSLLGHASASVRMCALIGVGAVLAPKKSERPWYSDDTAELDLREVAERVGGLEGVDRLVYAMQALLQDESIDVRAIAIATLARSGAYHLPVMLTAIRTTLSSADSQQLGWLLDAVDALGGDAVELLNDLAALRGVEGVPVFVHQGRLAKTVRSLEKRRDDTTERTARP